MSAVVVDKAGQEACADLEAAEEAPATVHLEPGSGGRLKLSIRITEDEEPGASSVSSVFTLCNSAIGAGVLSLPLAFRSAGLVGCFLMCLVIGACEGFTLYILSKFAERYDATTYSALVRKALGRKLSALLSIVMVLYLFGSCVAYLVIVGDSFSPLVALVTGTDSIWADRRIVIAVLCIAVITPMCFPRDLDALAWVSMAAVVGFIYTAVVVVVQGGRIVAERHDLSDVRLFHWDYEALFAIPIVVFGFNCHANVVTIFRELDRRPAHLLAGLPEHPSGFAALPSSLAPRPRTPKMVGMLGVIVSAVSLIMVGYLMVGTAGYLAFPNDVEGNVLNSFTRGAPILEWRPPLKEGTPQVARGVVGAVVVGHYPLNHHPARLAMEHLELFAFGWPTISVAFSSFQSLLFILSSLAVAVVVTDLGDVLHLVGGTAAAFMIFFLPGMLLVNAAIVKDDYVQEQQDLSQRGGNMAAALLEQTPSGDLVSPLLASPYEQGIKRQGLIYSPRKSWWAGTASVVLSLAIFTVTIITAIWK